MAACSEVGFMSHIFSERKSVSERRKNSQTSKFVLCAVVHEVEICFSNVKATVES